MCSSDLAGVEKADALLVSQKVEYEDVWDLRNAGDLLESGKYSVDNDENSAYKEPHQKTGLDKAEIPHPPHKNPHEMCIRDRLRSCHFENFIFSQFRACDFQGLPLFIRIGDIIKSHIRGFFRRKGVSMCQEKWFL